MLFGAPTLSEKKVQQMSPEQYLFIKYICDPGPQTKS